MQFIAVLGVILPKNG